MLPEGARRRVLFEQRALPCSSIYRLASGEREPGEARV